MIIWRTQWWLAIPLLDLTGLVMGLANSFLLVKLRSGSGGRKQCTQTAA
jgi:hypothetical protein